MSKSKIGQYKVTIIAVAVLVLMIGALVVALIIKGDGSNDGGKGDGSTSGNIVGKPSVALFDLDEKEIVKIYTSFNEQYVLVKSEQEKDDGKKETVWTCESHSDIIVESDSADVIAESLAGLKGVKLENVEDATDYGFKDGKSDVYVTAETKDGKKHTAYVGNIDTATGAYYFVTVAGVENTVYKVYTSYAADLMVQKEDLINLKIFTFSSGAERKEFLVYKKGELAFEAKATGKDSEGSAEWKVKEPAVRDGENSAINNRIDAMRNITLAGIEEEKCQDLSKYGLDVPLIEYRLVMNENDQKTEYRVAIGDKNPESTCYYCIIDDSGDVYLVSTKYIYRDFEPLSFMDKFVFAEDTDTVKQLDLTVGDDHYELRFEYETVTETDKNTGETTEKLIIDRFFNGKNAPDDDDYQIITSDSSFDVLPPGEDVEWGVNSDNPKDCFQHVFLSLYVISYKEFDYNEPEAPGKTLMTTKYTMTDGTVTEITFKERDSTTAYVYINGEYANGYCSTNSFYGNDYDRAEVAAAIEAMETVMKLVP